MSKELYICKEKCNFMNDGVRNCPHVIPHEKRLIGEQYCNEVLGSGYCKPCVLVITEDWDK